ncbi:MAG: hypothetical protein MUC87_02760 [Bacteroidia bacterium]|jgi:hypothetical protein|nr:hypothetical protein [Bacteroidia bacterium]
MIREYTSRLLFILTLFFFSTVQTGITRFAAHWAGLNDEVILFLSEKAEETEKTESEKDCKESKEVVDDMLLNVIPRLDLNHLLQTAGLIELENALAQSYTGHPTSPPPEC